MNSLKTSPSPCSASPEPAGPWDSLLRQEWLDGLRGTAFLTRCRNGTITRAELHLFVRQHHFYSRYFTRYLCSLMSNMSDERDRIALTHNLFDEMGFSGGVSHAQIYRDMMSAMLTGDDGVSIFAGTQALIDTMFECCRSPRMMVGLGAICLGAEAIVPEIYTSILQGFAAVQEPEKNLDFFTIHVIADDDHALTMREIIIRELERDPRTRLDLEYGAQRAIAARVAFFEGIAAQSTTVH